MRLLMGGRDDLPGCWLNEHHRAFWLEYVKDLAVEANFDIGSTLTSIAVRLSPFAAVEYCT
jgi:hypothetical protein